LDVHVADTDSITAAGVLGSFAFEDHVEDLLVAGDGRRGHEGERTDEGEGEELGEIHVVDVFCGRVWGRRGL
jgi:hypothetical protein